MDSDQAKLFVGGISRDTTEDVLKHHFAKYGSVLGSTISLDRNTKIPRGFGFVRFSDVSAADQALQDTHIILGRTVEVKKAIPRSEHQHPNLPQNRGTSNCGSYDSSSDHVSTKKVFVGGLSAGVSEVEFKKYFERFGRITDVVVMQDSITHRPRGFGFITFDSEESVESVMMKSFHDLNGRQVEVKRAVPKDGNNNYDSGNRMRYKNGRGAPKGPPQYGPRYIPPAVAPLPCYGSDGLYFYGSNMYGCWFPMGGYGCNGSAVPIDVPRNFWYGPPVATAQTCQVPYASPTHAYGTVRGVLGSETRGYNGIMGSAENFKFNQVFSANGFLPADVTSSSPKVEDLKQEMESLSLKETKAEASS
ncbi:hypothetical protein QN277_015390 [Acacia crassicarpa]|uniref:RRM domain-containing protein n=1 Tax=Acacia crassicarpa TaxID=499986 RepID=A0AAE1JZR7_9FABA|nr:hypothetical protein QN277_015390 [Acacia crassicarpa]